MDNPLSETLAERQDSFSKKRGGPISCSNGLSFINVTSACIWLKDNTEFPSARCDHIIHACQGLRVQAYGFTWKFSLEADRVPAKINMRSGGSVLCSNNMVFENARSAAAWVRETTKFKGAKTSRILLVCRGEKEKHYGLGWSFVVTDAVNNPQEAEKSS